MSFGDLWNRTLVYFGIAEEDDDYYDDDEHLSEAEDSLEQSYRERPNVRRLTPRRRSHGYDDWTDSGDVDGGRTAAAAAAPALAPERSSRSSSRPVRHMAAGANPWAVRVHLVVPRGFNDAQQIADTFKSSIPVIL